MGQTPARRAADQHPRRGRLTRAGGRAVVLLWLGLAMLVVTLLLSGLAWLVRLALN